MKTWTEKQITEHKIAAEKLRLIKNEVASFISSHKEDVTESSIITFVKKQYKALGLINDKPKESCIVAFGVHTNEVHYFPTKKTDSKLKANTLILLDIWARLDGKNTPYADATFMFYLGKQIPNKIKETWGVLSTSRDKAISYIKSEVKNNKLPRGLDIDRVAHDIIGEAGLGQSIKHTVGHSLGFVSPHGKLPGINWREYSPIMKNVGYTIEPGIYLEDFGMRTEIDFYINENNEVIITTPIQKEIEIIK